MTKAQVAEYPVTFQSSATRSRGCNRVRITPRCNGLTSFNPQRPLVDAATCAFAEIKITDKTFQSSASVWWTLQRYLVTIVVRVRLVVSILSIRYRTLQRRKSHYSLRTTTCFNPRHPLLDAATDHEHAASCGELPVSILSARSRALQPTTCSYYSLVKAHARSFRPRYPPTPPLHLRKPPTHSSRLGACEAPA